MKRFIPFVVIFLLALAVYVYFEGGKKTVNTQDLQIEEGNHVKESRAMGVISSLGGIAVPGSGTHLLMTPDGKTILLVGLGANLDDFLSRSVEVEGRLTQTESGKELIQVLRVKLIDPLPDDAAAVSTSWEKFEDSDLGVMFSRRAHWDYTNSASKITFTLPAGAEGEAQSIIRIEKISNEKYLPLAGFTGDAKTSTKHLIGPRKLVGYRRVDPKDGVTRFVVAREKFVFVLSYTPGVVKSGDPLVNDFYTLVSSFEFVPVAKKP